MKHRTAARRAATGLALLAALPCALIAGCSNLFFKELERYTVKGYMAPELLPADREVGAWRKGGEAGLTKRDFKGSLGAEACARLKPWGLGSSVACEYRLGATGRTVRVEVYDLGRPRGAFDVYGLLRERALSESAGPGRKARVTKVGAQGLMFDQVRPHDQVRLDARTYARGVWPPERVLLFWAERFLVRLTEVGGGAAQAESALLAFGSAITKKVEKPYELAEVYVLQVKGEVPHSERYHPRKLLGRPELPSGATARWKGKTGEGRLFVSVFGSPKKAEAAFDRLREASSGVLTPTYADGLFVGKLPGGEPIACFRARRALLGLVGGGSAGERMAALDELRGRSAGDRLTPVLKPEEGGKK